MSSRGKTYCARVTLSLLSIPFYGVKKPVVGLALEEARVLLDPNLINTKRIIEAVAYAGLIFGADLINSQNDVVLLRNDPFGQ